jgi:hypothetical protein
MHYRWILLSMVLFSFAAPGLTLAGTGDLGAIIEGFITRHFPDATSHLWVVNSTQWDGDEMVVDVRTVVVEKQLPIPIENRYLLLIVKGKLAAMHRVPLEDGADCQPEQT